ncbi:MAG TPA: MMPL family transporter [Steroidobacteraceae bacterium]
MRRKMVVLMIWLAAISVAGALVARAKYTADLSAFLPSAPTAAQRMLVRLLRDGPTSQLMLVSIQGTDAATRARLSQQLAAKLRTAAAFRSVANGEMSGLQADSDFIFNHRYALSRTVTDSRFTVVGLTEALRQSVELLASPLGLLSEDLLAKDPTGEAQQVLDQLDTSSHPRAEQGVWVSADGKRALLLLQTRALGSDTDGQQLAIDTIRHDFAALSAQPVGTAGPAATLLLSGPGVFAAEARATIEHEAVRLSTLSLLLIATLLLLLYRSVPALLLGFLPVVSGILAGVAAVALGFGVVHGLTLGFGVTLIGEAVDYSIYLFIQAERSGAGADANWLGRLWPTIRLGMLTSVVGFASLLFSDFPGLAQLGLYSIAGLIAAALVTRFVLPHFLPRHLALQSLAAPARVVAGGLGAARRWRALLWLLPSVACLCLCAHRGQLWNRELSALSPVPAAALALDGQLRADLGAPDVRHLVVASAPDAESALRAAEQISAKLDALVDKGAIAGFESPSRFLPSLATQQARREALPPPELLKARLAAASHEVGIRGEQLGPFLADVQTARTAAPLTPADVEGTTLSSGLDALLIHDGNQWSALLPLRAPAIGPHAQTIDTEPVRTALDSVRLPGTTLLLLDLKQQTDALYDNYLSGAIRLSLLGLAGIALLLLLVLRSAARTVKVMAPLLLAVLCVVAGFALLGHSLTILHLIGLLLIVAVGSNYALFFDRESAAADADEGERTLSSLLVANATTVIGFGVLATSSVPVLSALGSTVAPGAVLALLFSAVMARSATGRSLGQ